MIENIDIKNTKDIVKVQNTKFPHTPFKMYLSTTWTPGHNVANYIREHGFWAQQESYMLYKVLSKYSGTVVDVGSNSGYFSLLAHSLGSKRIIAVDPNEVHNEVFSKSIRENNAEEHIQIVNKFVSDSKYQRMFDGWTGHSELINDDLSHVVETTALKDLAPDGAIFLKVDVEGAEPEVFRSAGNLIKDGKFPFIMFEVTYTLNDHETDGMLIDLEEYYDLFLLNDNSSIPVTARRISQHLREAQEKHGGVVGKNVFAIYKSQNYKIGIL